MDFKIVLALIAIVMTVTGYFYYFKDIFAGKTKPHAFTWLVWAFLTAIAYVGQVSDNAGAGAWITLVTAIASFIICFLALKKGEKDITRSDWISLLGAGFALLLWFLTSNPLYAIILITLIDFLGFLPTIRKSISKPFEETLITYLLSGLKFVIAIAAIDHYSLITTLYPASLVFANLLFVILLIVKRKQVTQSIAM
jgi:hypothetical protein